MSFDPAAVFETPDGFVVGLLKPNVSYPPHKEATEMKNLTGYNMVSYCEELLGIWSDYKREKEEPTTNFHNWWIEE